jgi:hypothetical protein
MGPALLIAALVVVATIATIAVMRGSGARPDDPEKGARDEPGAREAAGTDSEWSADRPGGPGLEGMNPETGDPTAGPEGGDEPGRNG